MNSNATCNGRHTSPPHRDGMGPQQATVNLRHPLDTPRAAGAKVIVNYINKIDSLR